MTVAGKKNPNLASRMRELWADPEWRAQVLAKRTPRIQASHKDPAVRERMSAGQRARWAKLKAEKNSGGGD